MTYHQAFDCHGNPIARPVRFSWLRRITQSCDADGVMIIAGVAMALAAFGLWISGLAL
jgi:hypothetical protein